MYIKSMEIKKDQMKVRFNKTTIFSILCLFAISLGLQAQSLDPDRYQKIKALAIQTGHIEKENLIKEIHSITPNPLDYLIAISKEPGLRVYAISQINELIADFGGNEAKDYLESSISDESVHPSIRSSAVYSYGKTFYSLDKTGTENFLKQYSGHNRIGVSIRNALKDLKSGKLKSVRFSIQLKKNQLELKDKNLRKPQTGIRNQS
ncbi:hypothetical protein AB3N59_17805 [Leptospira sp. WS92.C1]